jgi:ribose transport system substrate-binding protein
MPLLSPPRPDGRRRGGGMPRWALAAGSLPLALLLVSCTTEQPAAPTSPPPAANTAAANAAGNAPAGNGPAADTPATSKFEAPRKASGDINIMVITNGISPFWDPMGVAMNKAAGEVGCKASWTGPPNSNVTEQKRLVEDAIAKGVDGIAISCIEAKAAEPLIQEALDKNIPVVTFDSDSPGSARLAYIGTNNFKAGQAAGQATVELLPQGGKLVGFVGNISAQNARERRDGFVDATKSHKIDLIDVLDDGKSKERARRNVEDQLAKQGDKIQGFLGLFSYNGPAIEQAVSSANAHSKYKIVCFDAEPETLPALEKGAIDATVVQSPYEFGYRATKLLYLINRKGWAAAKKEMNVPDDGIVDTGVEVITPKTVADYKKRLEKLGVKSS